MKISILVLLIATMLYYVKSMSVSTRLRKEQSSTNEYLKSLNMMNTNLDIYSNLF